MHEPHTVRGAIVDSVNVHVGSRDYAPWFDDCKACSAETAANAAMKRVAVAATAD